MTATVAALLMSAAASAKTYTVVIDKLKFDPLPSGLHVGDMIIWDNRDIFQHSVTARDKSFNVELAAGKSGQTVLRRAGDIPIFCRYHPGMTGVLKVAK